MPAAFLMQQMEWREAIEDALAAHDISALESLLKELHQAGVALEAELHINLDQQPEHLKAAEAVRKLRFLDKVRDEIDNAIASLEN